MSETRSSMVQRTPYRPLAAAVISIFALSIPVAATAADWTVDSCDGDDTSSGSVALKTGSLRFAVANADDGDTVDLSSLSCPSSKISLTTGGYIAVLQPSLRIKGSAASMLTIDASALYAGDVAYSDNFYHFGNGTLTVQNLALAGGHINHRTVDALGGCIYSKGSVVLDHAELSSCSAHSLYVNAKGGGVYAKGGVSLYNSSVSQSSAIAAGTATGGGIYSKGNLTVEFSTVSGNKANGANSFGGGAGTTGTFLMTYSSVGDNKAYGFSYGGGLGLRGKINTISASTISGNVSEGAVGGLDVATHGAAGGEFLLTGSTISGNQAVGGWAGGMRIDAKTAKFYNSTIAFNQATYGSATEPAGVFFNGDFGTTEAFFESTLIANNVVEKTSTESDIGEFPAATVTVNGGLLGVPANNLIRAAAIAKGMPSDTKTDCPLLGQLRDNGGLTMTHALLSTSPAIDNGNDFFLAGYDQRGAGLNNGVLDYLRTSGLSAKTDIGAYEVQQEDIVFNTAFEGCL